VLARSTSDDQHPHRHAPASPVEPATRPST
jgi:hypothetical protein